MDGFLIGVRSVELGVSGIRSLASNKDKVFPTPAAFNYVNNLFIS